MALSAVRDHGAEVALRLRYSFESCPGLDGPLSPCLVLEVLFWGPGGFQSHAQHFNHGVAYLCSRLFRNFDRRFGFLRARRHVEDSQPCRSKSSSIAHSTRTCIIFQNACSVYEMFNSTGHAAVFEGESCRAAGLPQLNKIIPEPGSFRPCNRTSTSQDAIRRLHKQPKPSRPGLRSCDSHPYIVARQRPDVGIFWGSRERYAIVESRSRSWDRAQ